MRGVDGIDRGGRVVLRPLRDPTAEQGDLYRGERWPVLGHQLRLAGQIAQDRAGVRLALYKGQAMLAALEEAGISGQDQLAACGCGLMTALASSLQDRPDLLV